jgi:DNA-binding winged helix-turn-helix (wHTH) protein/Tol biopolymer transport system component
VQYRFGPFRLDPQKRRLWRGDELVSLTPKAVDILLVLVARAGQVVEKDDVLKEVWPGTFIEEATLAQNVSILRKALGETSDNPRYIATSPRRGYRFIETVTVDDSQAVEFADVRPAIAAATRRPRGTLLGIALVAVVLLSIVTALWLRPEVAASPLTRAVFSIDAPESTEFSASGGLLAVSPNGRYIAFVATDADGVHGLWVRAVDSLQEQQLPGTEGAAQPFWSPDSRFVAFFSDGKLRRIGLAGEPIQIVCDVPGGTPLAGTWNSRNDILFPTVRQGIYRVTALGGVPTALAMASLSDTEVASWPQFLPDGDRFLYTVRSARADRAGVFVGSLAGAERTRVLPAISSALYTSGYLLYVDRGILWAQPFDTKRLRLSGEPVQIAEDVAFNVGTGRGTFSASQNGLLAYRAVTESQLTWFDRAGHRLEAIGQVGRYLQFSVAPDDSKVAAARLDPVTGTSQIWVLTGNDAKRLTFSQSFNRYPLWSRDGTRVLFASNRDERWAIYEADVAGARPEQRVLAQTTSSGPQDWTPDGRLLIQRWDRSTNADFWLIGPAPSSAPIRLESLDAAEESGQISPDGRWLAFVADEVYVRPLESIDRRWQISSSGGNEPRWRNDGKELFYLSSDLSLMSAEIRAELAFHAQPARALFQTRAIRPTGLTGQAYDVTSDGQRFLIKVAAANTPITVVLNWLSLVQQQPH